MTEGVGEVNTFELALNEVDKDSPLTADVLIKLLKAQSEYLLGKFTQQLADQDKIIKSQFEEIQSLKAENRQLSDGLDELQQYSRRNAIRISGVPDEPGDARETIQTLETKVKKMFDEILNVKLQPSDFCRMHRVGKPQPNKPKQVILKFTNYGAKRRIMQARKSLRDHAAGGGERYYINDDLTKKRASVARVAREARKRKTIKDTWVYDGRIYIKLNSDVIKVANTELALKDVLSEL